MNVKVRLLKGHVDGEPKLLIFGHILRNEAVNGLSLSVTSTQSMRKLILRVVRAVGVKSLHLGVTSTHGVKSIL